MIVKSLEIHYSFSDIAAAEGEPVCASRALEFRNAAMCLIEDALTEAEAGEWAGAEIGANLETGAPEVNIGFDVEDFDRAEAIVRAAVEGTPYAAISEIERREFDPAQLAAALYQ